MAVIRAGELRHRVIIQSPTRARDAHGGFTLSWANVRTISAKIDPKSGKEFFFSEAIRAQTSHFLTIRAQTETITPDMRITFGTRVFNIVAALLVDEIKHMVLIAATENTSIAEDATGTNNRMITYETDEIDFTTTHSISRSIPTNFRFYPRAFHILCSTLSGTVVTQPTITLGITGSLTKYASKLPTLITAVNNIQSYGTLLDNEGETALKLGISIAGAVSALGSYKGRLIVEGLLVPA